LDPGLFRRQGDLSEKKEARIAQFLDVLQRAVGVEPKEKTKSSVQTA
jgi:hypothetical protein